MIRDVQKQAAQPQKIAGHLEIDNLPLPVGQVLVGTGPAGHEDIGRLIRLALMDQIAPSNEGATPFAQAFEYVNLGPGQGNERTQLADERKGGDDKAPFERREIFIWQSR